MKISPLSFRKCLIPDCENKITAKNLCNKHYLKDYFSRQPGSDLYRGQKWVRRNTLAVEVSELTGFSVKKSRKLVRIILNVVTEAIKQGKEVQIPGFGIFGTHSRSRRWFGPPVYFIPSKELQSMMKDPTC